MYPHKRGSFISLIFIGLAWSVQGQVRIVSPEHQPVYAQGGTDLTLACLAQGDDCPFIDWYHGVDHIDVLAGDSHFSDLEHITRESDTCYTYNEFTVSGLTQADAGMYSCVERYGGGSYNVLVFVVTIRPLNGVMTPGNSVTIGCEVSDNVSRNPNHSPMKWFRNGRPLHIDNRKYVTDLTDDTHLIINHTRREDAGEYRCAFELPNGEEYSQVVNLEVE